MLKIFIGEKYFIIYTQMLSKKFSGGHAVLPWVAFSKHGATKFFQESNKAFQKSKIFQKIIKMFLECVC